MRGMCGVWGFCGLYFSQCRFGFHEIRRTRFHGYAPRSDQNKPRKTPKPRRLACQQWLRTLRRSEMARVPKPKSTRKQELMEAVRTGAPDWERHPGRWSRLGWQPGVGHEREATTGDSTRQELKPMLRP